METFRKVTKLAIDLLGVPAELAGAFMKIHETFDKWVINEGNQGIKRSKEVFAYTLSYLLGENPPLPGWLAPSKVVEGSPKILEQVFPWIIANPRRGLTMIRYSDLYLATLDDDNCSAALRPITDPPNHHYEDRFVTAILSEAERLYSDLKVDVGSVPLFTKGPNGISILSVHKDSIALHREQALDPVRDLGKAIAASVPGIKPSEMTESITSVFTEDYNLGEVRSGSLVFLPEKSAKIRVIAQGDYITQATLKPIHDSLAAILRRIPEDWMFDQNGGKEWVRKKTATAKFAASYDLSNATDRLPLDLQAEIIDRALPGKLGQLWAKVLRERQFTYTLPSGITGKVKYAVGQPMGFYSSFPAFALLHHCIVRSAFVIAHGRPGHKFYAILGDDMVIFDKAAADVYVDIIASIGGVINLSKSRISTKKGDIRAEFAKAYFRNGVSITPFSLRKLNSSLNNWANVPNLVNDLRIQLGVVVRARKLKKILQEYWPNEAKILMQLLEVPVELGGFGKPGHTPLVKVLKGPNNTFRRYLAYRAYEAYKMVVNISNDEIDKATYGINDRNELRLALQPFMTLLRDRNASIGLNHMVTGRFGFLQWAMSGETPLSALIDCVTLMTKELPVSLREKVRRPSVMWVRASVDDRKTSTAADDLQSMFYAFEALRAATA